MVQNYNDYDSAHYKISQMNFYNPENPELEW